MTDINRLICSIHYRYDADNDLPRDGQPQVTWADAALLDIILDLSEKLNNLQARVDQLERETAPAGQDLTPR
jgi:hypothetical protein